MNLPEREATETGAQSLVGYHIDMSDPDGSAVVWLEIEPKHLNRNQTLHGGIHAMMLDAAAGFAASRFLSGQGVDFIPVVTLSLATTFLAPGRVGIVTVTGRVQGGGHKVVYANAEMRDADGVLLSQANGVFKRTAN